MFRIPLAAQARPVIAICALMSLWTCSESHRGDIKSAIASKANETGKAGEFPPVQRSSYPYSVIVGGAYSPEELARARRSDRVVREHYAQFGEQPEFRRADRDFLAYVSYRKKDRVYWTRTRHRIKRGEVVLIDGAQMARARCGNQLAFHPQKPVESNGEPAEDTLGTPETPQLPVLSSLRPPDLPNADLYVPELPPPGNLPDLAPALQRLAQPTSAVPAGSTYPAVGGYQPPGISFSRAPGASPNSLVTSGLPGENEVPVPTTNVGSGGPPSAVAPPFSLVPVPSINPPIAAVPEPDFSRIMWPGMLAGLVFLAIRKTAGRM